MSYGFGFFSTKSASSSSKYGVSLFATHPIVSSFLWTCPLNLASPNLASPNLILTWMSLQSSPWVFRYLVLLLLSLLFSSLALSLSTFSAASLSESSLQLQKEGHFSDLIIHSESYHTNLIWACYSHIHMKLVSQSETGKNIVKFHATSNPVYLNKLFISMKKMFVARQDKLQEHIQAPQSVSHNLTWPRYQSYS